MLKRIVNWLKVAFDGGINALSTLTVCISHCRHDFLNPFRLDARYNSQVHLRRLDNLIEQYEIRLSTLPHLARIV